MSDYIGGKKPKKVRYHFSIVFLAAVVVFGVMFYRYMKSTTLEDVLSQEMDIVVPANSDKNNEQASSEDEQTDSDANADESVVNPVAESEAVDSEYLDSCVFIGDSIMYGLSSYGLVPASNVYASMSMDVSEAETQTIQTSQYGEVTILEALESSMPQNIYIMLGSKGSAYMTPSQMYSDYSSFVNKVKSTCPDANIYLISVPPVTNAKEQSKESPVQNSDLDSFNELVLEYANTHDVYYLDLNSYLKDDTGKLPAADAENDGVHFKYSTYEKFIDYVLTHVAG